MRLFTGLLSAAISGFITLALGTMASAGLPGPEQQIVPIALLVLGALIGFLVGATIATRATRDTTRLPIFGALTAAIGGGLLAMAACIVTLALYLVTYGSWPDEPLDRVLYVLAFPALGTFAFFLGAAVFSIFGLVAGSAFRLMAGGKV